MPEKKKQHYVPKQYLKFFSNFEQRTHVRLYNLRTKLYLKSASIDGQNQKDYFYGKTPDIENAFAEFETRTCDIIREIIQTNSLPTHESDDYWCLLVYVMYQQNRTQLSALKIEKLLNQVTLKMLKDRFVPTSEIQEIKQQFEYPGIASLENVPELIDAVSDLKCKLLINKTKHSFITSDHPVVKWNQFLNKRKYHDPRVGFNLKGLKLFFPISPNIMLMYYDRDIYTFENETDSVDIFNERDVWILNLIQTYTCNELVFFNQTIDEVYINRLFDEQLKIQLKINKLIEDYCKKKNTRIHLNEIQKENLIMEHIGVLSFITEHSQVKQLSFTNPVDYIRSRKNFTTKKQ